MVDIKEALTTDEETKKKDDDWLAHYACDCMGQTALCGKYLEDEDYRGPLDDVPSETKCVVCDALSRKPCPRCGKKLE